MEGLGCELVVGQKNVLGFGAYARRCGECGATGRAGPGCSTKEAATVAFSVPRPRILKTSQGVRSTSGLGCRGFVLAAVDLFGFCTETTILHSS